MEPADPDDVAADADGPVVGTVSLPDGRDLPVTLDGEIVARAQEEGVDVDRLADAATASAANTPAPTSATVDLSAQTDGDDTATIPVQDHQRTDLTNRLRRDREHRYIQDDQIQRLIRNSVNYTERVGRFLLREDDLIPTVKERLKALIVGEDGLSVEPADPNDDADQQLADFLEERYEDDVQPGDVIDRILRENMMNARAVLRATDLRELDLNTLDYLRDGITGEEIYIQDETTVHRFVVEDGDSGDAIPGIDLERESVDAQPLVIGDHVFDVNLYDQPPLEAVADTAVNKMVLQRLKARKAEITSFGAVYAKVEPPSYLPEKQYFDRVKADDWDGEGDPPTKLERAMKSNIQSAFDTLKDFQSGTVMSVPDFWTLEQLEIPETGDPLDDQIRGYNRDISRRLLVPLDLIELQSGSELSRETMFQTLMTTIAGWRQEIIRVFDQYADVQAEIEGMNGDVTHSFPPLKDANTQQIVASLQHAGIAGLTQKEVRTMLNAIQGVDLDTDPDSAADTDGDLPEAGGPDGPDRGDQLQELLNEQRRGPPAEPGADPSGDVQAADGAVRFGNVGGDPFTNEDVLADFVAALEDAGADHVRIGNEPWGEHTGIHDRPVIADDITVETAADTWERFRDDAVGLTGPTAATAAENVDLSIPKAVQNAAQDALDARDDDNTTVNGMTDVGWSTAETLADGGSVSEAFLLDGSDAMAAWWARHKSHTLDTSGDQVTLDGSGADNPWSDNSYTSGKGWGGVAGARFAFRKAAQLLEGDDADQYRGHLETVTAAQPGPGGGSGNGRPGGGGGPTPTGNAAQILDSVPFLPPVSGTGPVTVPSTRLRDWVAWTRAGRPRLEGDWNPSLHPRGPDGAFVERPYEIPDGIREEIADLDTSTVLDRLAREGELSNGDLHDLLQDGGVRIDGVPDVVQNRRDLQDAGSDGSDSDAQESMGAKGYVSPDAPDLRVESADTVIPLLGDNQGNAGSAAKNMDVARFDTDTDGDTGGGERVAFIKEYRDDQGGSRSDGEKPTNAEREVAADVFLRNIGFEDHLPALFNNDEDGYAASEKIDGEAARLDAPGGADAVDQERFNRFAGAIMILGNSDLHGDNWRIQEDGSFYAIDLNKSGGDFTEPGEFRSRGKQELLNVASTLGIDFDADELQQSAEGVAGEIDLGAALEDVPNSDVSGADRHQYRENIRRNIEAFQAGEINL